jgi:hypothetical protein
MADLLVEKAATCGRVADEEFVGEPDLRVAGAAAREGRMVVAVDRGFGDVRLYPPGSRPAIWQCARVLRQSVIFMLLAIFPVEPDIEGFARCNVVIEPGSVRARRASV